jgi:hypothetical protein
VKRTLRRAGPSSSRLLPADSAGWRTYLVGRMPISRVAVRAATFQHWLAGPISMLLHAALLRAYTVQTEAEAGHSELLASPNRFAGTGTVSHALSNQTNRMWSDRVTAEYLHGEHACLSGCSVRMDEPSDLDRY